MNDREAFWYVFIALILVVLTVGLATIVNGADYTTVATHGPAGDYCAFPGACRLPDGRIVCVYYNGTSHVTPQGKGGIAYVTSEDEGVTWSEPRMLLNTPLDDRDPEIAVLRDGRIILSYFRLRQLPELAGDGVYIAEIMDGGVDGDTRQPLESGIVGENPPVKMVPLQAGSKSVQFRPVHIRKLQHDAGTGGPVRDFGGGLLMLGTYHIDQPYVLRSADNGKTWQVFAIPNGGKHLDAETDTIRVWRNGPHQVDIETGKAIGPIPKEPWYYAALRGTKCNGHYSTSLDGKNWTTAKDLGFPLDCPALHRVELGSPTPAASSIEALPPHSTAAHSAILLAHRLPHTAMHYSLDECRTWQGPVVVDTCGGAYPAFVTLEDGSVLIVYYTEGKGSDIRCRRFTVTREGIQWKP